MPSNAENPTIAFRHSGKLGDIIYSLPAIRAIGEAEFYIHVAQEHLDLEGANSLLPLLLCQPYVHDASIWCGQEYEHDLDDFRNYEPMITNIADCHLKLLDLPLIHRSTPWIHVDIAVRFQGQDVAFARSRSFRGCPGFWEMCYREFSSRAFFVGTQHEHEEFCAEIGPVPRAEAKDLLELAQMIAGCRLFVGNQSCPLAIAEALKKPVVQEVHAFTPNCVFYRELSYPVWETRQLPGLIDEIRQLRI